ncbi:High-affinity nicotinic acid transporter [Trametes pubescens]|uniref:High-affinity nicotinic acid transporter n=1 Tax=Trametes pubescens TaxID=154538 RepID=A0A1M2V7N1_TRAPU|nr:High-affinity nicotinic acid transporter [Trametes pubescens]
MRSPFVFGGLLFSFIGFAINASNASIGVKYFGTFLIVIGCYLAAPIIIVWLGNNTVGHYKRGIGIGLQVMGGNIGGIVASNAYRVRDAPRYLPGRASKSV